MSIICTGCGKDIPFVGDVCPHCQRDKSGSQAYMVLACILFPVFGFVGYKLFGGEWGCFGGSVVGCVIAMLVTGVLGRSSPPKVQLVDKNNESATAQEQIADTRTGDTTVDSVEVRLGTLQTLREKGLIDEQEYSKKKQAILDNL